MATNENLIPIPGRLHSVATEGHVAGADEIYDDTLGKLQSEINASKADLVNGKVPSEQLPSYVDDVINGYYYNGSFYKEAAHTTVITGEEGKIYVDIPTDKSYRWSGSAYILISNPYSIDEEDLTVVNNNIKFKDRPNTDGMGRVILRKNMVSGVNTLTQDMMPVATGGNTIYVIQYDFTLGEDITVPANCVLEFDGGSVNGAHKLIGNSTYIKANNTKIFGNGLTLSGKYSNQFNVYWWGLKGDRTNAVSPTASVTGTDNSPYIESMLAALYTIGSNGSDEGGVTIFFPRGYYYFSREIVLSPVGRNIRNWGYNKTYEICGESKNETALVWDIEQGLSNTTRMLDLYIHDLSFINVAADVRGRFNAVADKETYVSNGYAIKVLNPEYTSKIENCYFANWYSCVEANETYGQFTIDNCITSRTIYGFVALNSNGINFKTNSINFAYEAGIYALGSLCYIDSICVEGAPFSNTDSTFPYAAKFHSIGILSVSSNFSVNYSYFEFIYIGLYLKLSSYNDNHCAVTLIYNYPQAIADMITNHEIVVENIYYYNKYEAVVPSFINFNSTYPTNINCNVIPPAAGIEWTFPKTIRFNSNWYYLCPTLILKCNANYTSSTRPALYKGNAVPTITGRRESKEYLATNYIGILQTTGSTLGGSDLRVLSTGRMFNSDSPGYVAADITEIAKGVQIDGSGIVREVLITKKTDNTETVLHTLQIGSTSRPSSPAVGCQFFDPTIGKPIWWNGTAWVDATGTSV